MNNGQNYNSYGSGANNVPNKNGGRPPKKKLRFHPNKDGIMALLVLFLVVILIITIIVCCAKAISDAVRKNKGGTTTSPSTAISTPITTTPPETTGDITTTAPFSTTAPPKGAWNENYVIKPMSSELIHEGDLVLVNYANEYTFPNSMKKSIVDMWGQSGYSSIYVLGNKAASATMPEYKVMLSKNIISPLVSMLEAMKRANPDTLSGGDKFLLSSGYRTYEYQQLLYSAAVNRGEEGYSQKAGFSEHHTGLVFDLKIFTAEKATVDLRSAEQDWITENCANYGFILRYDESKTDITKILGESWHFRYVGVPHAKYMTEHNLCLEEYVDMLRESHTYGRKEPLNFSYDGKSYTVYFVPADTQTGTTSLPVPSNSESYTVSGNNVDGFIVTVTK